MPSLTTFSKRFKNLRESAGLKQSEIAEKLGVSRGAISFYENGDRTPDIDFAINAAKYFCVSTDWLLGLSDYKSHETANLSVEDLGLSEQATTTLIKLSQSSKTIEANKVSALNLLLEDDDKEEWGSQLLHRMSDYLFSEPIPKQLLQFTPQGVRVLDSEPDLSDPEQNISNIEYVDVLYDKVLIDRITYATEAMRYQLRNPQTAEGVLQGG